MSWRFTIPGQPLSWNHAYKRVTYRQRQTDGSVRLMNRMAKVDAVDPYQEAIILIAKAARPIGWTHSKNQPVRILYSFYTNPVIDTDNMKKLINDALAKAIGINDRWFLTCDVVNEKVPDGQQRIEVEIDDEARHRGRADD